ncbi:MAG: hypothetical protein AAF297_08725 [Planctomycetota bacterium]
MDAEQPATGADGPAEGPEDTGDASGAGSASARRLRKRAQRALSEVSSQNRAEDPGGLEHSLADAFRQRLAREGHVTLGDLWDDLLFTRLVKAPALALRPERLVFGLACVVAIFLAVGGASAVTGGPFPNVAVFQTLGLVTPAVADDVGRGAVDSAGTGIGVIWAELGRLVTEQPIATVVFLLIAGSAWAVFGVAIGRGVAMESALGISLGLRGSLTFALRRAGSAIGALMLVPIVLVVALAIVGGVGAALLAVPGLDVIGAALFGLTLAVGGVVAVVGVAYVLSLAFAVQAISVEGDDAFDAVQRGLGYAGARPLALVTYSAIALVQGVVAVMIVWWIGSLALDLARGSVAVFGGDGAATLRAGLDGSGAAAGAGGLAGRIAAIWGAVPVAFAAAFAVSYWHTAGTILYVLMRRIVDGQDPEVIEV